MGFNLRLMSGLLHAVDEQLKRYAIRLLYHCKTRRAENESRLTLLKAARWH